MYKCKICGKKYTELTALYNHIETKHKEMIPKDMNVQQYYYYMKTGRMNGNCVMCKKPTTWNNNTGKYNRFCGDPKCKDEYVKIMKSRMIAKYGKTHLLNDPEKQREMLANRSISGVYKWSDGKHETTYTGSYELDFLKTLDGFFDWDPEDISMPSPHTYTYKYEGEDKFYIPDVFIHSLDLEIEIKDGGDNPNNHYKIQAIDKHKEALKDEVMCSQKAFHYIKITNKNYENFFEFLKEAKKAFEKYGDETKIPRIFKIEDIKGNYTIKESVEIIEEGVKDIISYFTGFGTRSHRDLDKVLSLNFDMVKNNPEELQAFLKRLAKSANTVDDIEYIRHMNKRSKDHCKMMMKKMPEMKDQYEKYYNWILDGGIEKDIRNRKKEVKIKESYDILEEKMNIDRALVWLEKPIEKLTNKNIKIYRGSSVLLDDVIEPRCINVGSTRLSNPRWSTYFWDNKEDAIKWEASQIMEERYKYAVYIGHEGKTLLGKPKDVNEKEFVKSIIADFPTFYVYEADINIHDLEMGTGSIIREYVVSKPVDITKRYEYRLNKELVRRCFQIVDIEVIEKMKEQSKGAHKLDRFGNHRNPLLSRILDNNRDLYRAIIRTDMEFGNVKVGDDLSGYRKSINYNLDNNTYGTRESYIIDRMEESSISIPQMSMYLQNEYEEEMRNYLNTYKKYYNLMLEEQPAAVKHINEDIRKCLIVIDGLADKGVENNLVQFAKDDLGEIVKASKHGKPVKVYEASGFKIPTKGELWISTDWHFYKNKDNTKFKINPNIDKILSNYKKCVKPNDTFIFLGDLYDARTIFDMKLVPKIFDIKGLKGHKIMIKGNHDVNTTQFYLDLGFDEVYEKTYNIGNIVFSHEPIEVNSDEINIHGHIHFSETYWGMESTNHLDAYVEHYDFKPVKINDIINEYRDSNRLTKKALCKFDESIIHESMVDDLVNIDDNDNEIIECKIIYNSNSNQLFSLMDINSKLIIENSFVVQREKVGTKCSVSPCYKDIEGEKILEFSLIFDDKVNIKDLNSKLTEGINITNLHKFNDESYKFIKEACIRLFGVYPKEIKIK